MGSYTLLHFLVYRFSHSKTIFPQKHQICHRHFISGNNVAEYYISYFQILNYNGTIDKNIIIKQLFIIYTIF